MLADASSPFDHAFAAQHGANVAATVDTTVATAPQLAATAHAHGVTAAAGPFSEIPLTAQVTLPGISRLQRPAAHDHRPVLPGRPGR